MRESRESFQHLIRESREERRALHEESARQAAVTQKMFEATQKTFKDVRTVGFAIVKTLNRHTRLLESMDRKLGVRGNSGTGNGRTV